MTVKKKAQPVVSKAYPFWPGVWHKASNPSNLSFKILSIWRSILIPLFPFIQENKFIEPIVNNQKTCRTHWNVVPQILQTTTGLLLLLFMCLIYFTVFKINILQSVYFRIYFLGCQNHWPLASCCHQNTTTLATTDVLLQMSVLMGNHFWKQQKTLSITFCKTHLLT